MRDDQCLPNEILLLSDICYLTVAYDFAQVKLVISRKLFGWSYRMTRSCLFGLSM